MKGHTKIELTDVNTGEVKVIEHDNMVTSAIEKELLQSNGILPPAIIADVYSSYIPFDYIHNLFGGLFLFSNALSTDKEDYLVPFDNDMTGYSYYDITNTGKNTQLGSYSSKESGFQEDGSFKWVYNFDTTQANGQISAVALTTYVSGFLSAGIKNENFDNSKIPSSYYPSSDYYCINSSYGDSYGQRIKINYSGIPIYVDNEYVYVVKFGNFYYRNDAYIGKNNNKISVLKYASKLGKINPFEKYNEQYKILEEFTVDLPENFTFPNIEFASFDIKEDGTFYFICGSGERNTKGTVQLVKVDVLNRTSFLYNIKVPNDRYIKLGYTGYSYIYSMDDSFYEFCVHNNKFITYAPNPNSPSDYALYIYDMITESETILKDFPFSDASSPDLYLSKVYNDKYFFVQGFNSNSRIFFIFDIETNQLKRLCAKGNSYPTFELLKLGTRYFYFTGGKNYTNLYVSSHAQFLTTKNNLETPVTKTSSQSMKVTYTLTPA